MAQSEFLRRLGVEHPVMQAPLGGVSTNDLVAAVSNAGAMGWLGAAYLTPEQIAESVRRIRALTDKPFGVNLFAGGWQTDVRTDPGAMLAILSEMHERLALAPPTVPKLPPDPFPDQLDAVLEARPAAFGFTFGVPDSGALARVRARGIAIIGTATTVEEARILADARVDAIMAQGAEAGGHRGTFRGPFEAAMIPTSQLVAEVAKDVSVPVIASGGLMDGRDVAAAMARGAVAAALGTAFLTCPECGASEPYKRSLLAARSDTTVITRAFSGRPARGLANEFVVKMRQREDAIVPYPLQNALTRPMRLEAAKRGHPELLSLWAGQGVARVRALPARELVHRLVAEIDEARSRR